MDPYRLIVGVLLIVGGFAWTFIRILGAFAGEPDGPLWGYGPLIPGLGAAVVGILILIF